MVTPLLRMPSSREGRQLYISQMRSIYGSDIEIPDPDYGLAQDPYIYQKIMRDPVIAAALFQRFHMVAGNEWHMEPASDAPEDKAAAGVLEELFDHVSKFEQALYELSSAILKGRAYSYLTGKRKRVKVDGKASQDWWTPVLLRDIDKRRLRWVPDREQTGPSTRKIGQRLEYWSLENQENGGWHAVGEAARRALVVLTYQDREERLGMGEGIITPIYHFFWAKSQIWQEYMQGIERWAQGFITLTMSQDRVASTTKANDALIEKALNAIDRMRSRNAMVVGEGDELDFHETSGGGSNLADEAMATINEDLTRLILGSIRPTGINTDTGSLSQGEVEQDSTDVLIAYDRKLLASAITDHAVRCVWTMNRPQLIAQGLGNAQMPRFVISHETEEDPQAVAEQIETLGRAGLPLSLEEAYERAGWRMPTKDEDTIKTPDQQGGMLGSPFGVSADGELTEAPEGGEEAGHETSADGDTVVGGESIAAQGVEPPSMQEVSLAYERSIKNGDRATANLMRKKLWAITGENREPLDITDAEWQEMTSAGSGGGVEPVPPTFPKGAK